MELITLLFREPTKSAVDAADALRFNAPNATLAMLCRNVTPLT